VQRREELLALRQQLLENRHSSDSSSEAVDSDNIESDSAVPSEDKSGDVEQGGANEGIEHLEAADEDRNSEINRSDIENVPENDDRQSDSLDRHSESDDLNINDVHMDSESSESGGEVDFRNLTEEEKEMYLVESLRQWGSSPGVISMRKIEKLLIRLSAVFTKVPRTYKTLLNTGSEAGIEEREDHLMWYFGIGNSLDE
jgi:hypothetical protein